jgi:hypothetical protein
MSETEESGGLLDGVSAEAEVDTDSTTSAEAEISHAAVDPNAEDDSPLERPDWWPEKFWSKDSNEPEMEKLAGAYAELEKKFRAGGHKAPEQYNTEVFGNTPTDDPVVKTYMSWAEKYGISQEAFNDLASQVLEFNTNEAERVKMSVKAEKEALGPNADAIIKSMATWGNGLVQKGIWGQDDYEEFKIWGGTAAGIKALQKLRATYEGRVPIEAVKPEGMPSKDELFDMVAKPEYRTDPAYRKKVEKMFEQAFGEAA